MVKNLKISDVKIDGGTQQREKINPDIVAEYAEAMRCGAQFPPVVVFSDGVFNWLADGFHRFHARRAVPDVEISAEVHVGTNRDAILYSTGANNTHGQRLSNADKRKAVGIMLNDSEWSQWSDHQIAKHCKVTQPFVSQQRKAMAKVICSTDEQVITVIRGVATTQGLGATQAACDDSETAETAQDLGPSEDQNPDFSGPECGEHDHEKDELAETVRMLADENESLRDRIAIEVMPVCEEEKNIALETILELRKDVKRLEIENRALAASRDSYQREAAELKRQCAAQRREIARLKSAGGSMS